MKNRKRLTIAVVIMLFMLLSGCASKEPNDIAYVVALGIDRSDNDNYKVTIQYANSTQISGGEEGGKTGTEIVENIIVEAPNIYSAVSTANRIVSKNFSLAHAKLVVFSSEVAKEGLGDLVGSITRNEELRPDVYFAVSRDEAEKYLTSVNPEMEVNPAEYYQMIYAKNNVGGVEMGQEKDFFFGLETKDYDSILPIAGTIEASGEKGSESGGGSGGGEGGSSSGGGESGGGSGGGESGGGSGGGESGGSSGGGEQEKNSQQKEAPVNEEPFEYKIKNYVGGQAAMQRKNKSEVIGSAVFSDDKLVCMLGSVEEELLKIIDGNYDYSHITFFSEKTPETPVTVKAEQEKKPKYNIDLKNKKVDIELFIQSDLSCMPTDYNIEKDIEEFESSVEKGMSDTCNKFINDFLHKYNCDVLKIKKKSKIKFLTNSKYEEFKNSFDLREFEFSVKTNFNIRRTGLIMRED